MYVMFVVDEDDDDEKFLHNRNFLHSQTTIIYKI